MKDRAQLLRNRQVSHWLQETAPTTELLRRAVQTAGMDDTVLASQCTALLLNVVSSKLR